jgi:hypothetical protein
VGVNLLRILSDRPLNVKVFKRLLVFLVDEDGLGLVKLIIEISIGVEIVEGTEVNKVCLSKKL